MVYYIANSSHACASVQAAETKVLPSERTLTKVRSPPPTPPTHPFIWPSPAELPPSHLLTFLLLADLLAFP